jgi:hypothetical protein
MTTDEVRKLATDLGADEFSAPTLAGKPGIPDYYVSKNERLISLWFHDGRLVGYLSGLSSIEHSEEASGERVNICSKSNGGDTDIRPAPTSAGR